MPYYEYECQSNKCGVVSEVYQSLHEEQLVKCPICKRGKVIKLISLTSHPVVPQSPRDFLAGLKADARKTAKKIMRGDENAMADVYGDPSGNKKAEQTTAKTLDQVKSGKIKRKK
jgi:putative FmdB family regulatory protein